MDFKATIVGGKSTKPTNSVKATITKSNKESIQMNNPHPNNNEASDIVSIVKECKRCINQKSLAAKNAAYIIVGKIRAIYYENCTTGDEQFNIEAFSYIDQILFDPLASLVEGIIKFGSGGISKSLMKETIKNAVSYIDYKTDINKMYEVIDVVYTVFS